jgi:hypothetical protein
VEGQRQVAGIGRHVGHGSLGGIFLHQPAVIGHRRHAVRPDHVDGQRLDIGLRQSAQQQQREENAQHVLQCRPEIGFNMGFHNASLGCTTHDFVFAGSGSELERCPFAASLWTPVSPDRQN